MNVDGPGHPATARPSPGRGPSSPLRPKAVRKTQGGSGRRRMRHTPRTADDRGRRAATGIGPGRSGGFLLGQVLMRLAAQADPAPPHAALAVAAEVPRGQRPSAARGAHAAHGRIGLGVLVVRAALDGDVVHGAYLLRAPPFRQDPAPRWPSRWPRCCTTHRRATLADRDPSHPPAPAGNSCTAPCRARRPHRRLDGRLDPLPVVGGPRVDRRGWGLRRARLRRGARPGGP